MAQNVLTSTNSATYGTVSPAGVKGPGLWVNAAGDTLEVRTGASDVLQARVSSASTFSHCVRISLNPSGNVVDLGALANPFGRTVYITRAILVRNTGATNACTLDIGPAADAVTLNDTVLDGVNAQGTAGSFADTAAGGGTNGLSSTTAARAWTASQFVTVRRASGDTTGFSGELYLEVLVPPA